MDMPLYLEHVAPNGRAAHAGLMTGDVLLAIDRQPTRGFTHDQGKSAILRGGNELDIIVQRGGMTVHPMSVAQPEERSQIVEEPIAKLGGSTYKEVQPKTYQVLQSELDEGGAAQQAPPSAGGRPASIFDRKRDDRSGYLKAQGPTIQKAYGQTQ